MPACKPDHQSLCFSLMTHIIAIFLYLCKTYTILCYQFLLLVRSPVSIDIYLCLCKSDHHLVIYLIYLFAGYLTTVTINLYVCFLLCVLIQYNVPSFNITHAITGNRTIFITFTYAFDNTVLSYHRQTMYSLMYAQTA